MQIFPSPDDAGRAVGEWIAAAADRDPALVVGLATGSSPVAAYRAWGAASRRRGTDLSRVRAFALDEYIGMDPARPESYHSVIARDAVVPVGLTPALVRVPRADTLEDAERAAGAYEAEIAAAGGIDVQVLGIGRNGHLAFNEPGSSCDSRTRAVALARETRADNARFFSGASAEVPTHGITQGLGTIFEARTLLVIATGAQKAAAVAAAMEGPISEAVPASLLRTRDRVHWFLDAEAASSLSWPETQRSADCGAAAV